VTSRSFHVRVKKNFEGILLSFYIYTLRARHHLFVFGCKPDKHGKFEDMKSIRRILLPLFLFAAVAHAQRGDTSKESTESSQVTPIRMPRS
jgi:hypothetical protein